MTLRNMAKIALVSLGMAVAGCTNNPSDQVVLTAVKDIADGRNPPAQPSEAELQQQLRQAMASTDGPLGLVRFEKPGTVAIIRVVETNGPYRTWGSWGLSERRSLTTRNGFVTATRGLGRDLMSSDIAGSLALVSARRAGQATRTQRYLDGNNQTYAVTATCTITNRGAAGGNLTLMQERCVADDQEFTNAYKVTDSGVITESSQWLGDYFGKTVLQRLR
jgi:hypothetical protein